MNDRRAIHTYTALAKWYDDKYTEMGGCWYTPAAECNTHLDDLGVPVNEDMFLLDVGCGDGALLEEASKRVSCCGLEISKVAIGHARKRLGEKVKVLDCSIEEYDPLLYFDFVISLGSLEHVLNLDKALRKIHSILTPETGKFYFYNPNTKWVHLDQPNELTADEPWWREKLAEHGLQVTGTRDWNDNTAYWGVRV